MKQDSINILVLEDQKHIRQGIVTMLQHIGKSIPLKISEFATAEDVIQTYNDIKPQIILVDIILDSMNGLELIKYMRNADYNGHVIIISSHDDFEYARQAIELKVDHYLIKPVQYKELFGLISSLSAKIAYSRDQFNIVAEKNYLYTSRLLINRLEGLDHVYTELELFNSLGIFFKHDSFQIVFVQFSQLQHNDIVNACFRIRKQLKKVKVDVATFIYDPDCRIIICNFAEADILKVNALILQAFTFPFQKTCCGIGSPVHSFEKLSESYTQAKTAWEECVFRGKRMLQYNEIQKHAGPYIHIDQYNILIQAIRRNSETEIESALREVFFTLDHISVNKDEFVGELTSIIHYLQQNMAISFGQGTVTLEIEKLIRTLRGYGSILEIKSKVKEYLFELIKSQQKEQTNYIVNYILLYIDKNYAEKISLNTIAKELNVSYNYASSIFSQKSGIRFSNYLLDYRLEKAASMLHKSNEKINIVAQKCGFYDSHSFSKAFKKKYGKMPKEYRNSGFSTSSFGKK